MRFSFITLFPQLIKGYFSASILSRAVDNGIIEIKFINPRDYSRDKHRRVDDYMIGGGAGLLLHPEPISLAIDENFKKKQNTHFIFLSPVGKKFSQQDAKRLSKKSDICFVCGRYEGFDERLIELYANEVFSIGDFVLTGGELAATCICDAISRNVPNVLGNCRSLDMESFENEMLESPSFTKPYKFGNKYIISEYLKGNHSKISALKLKMALCKTRFFRPDLYQKLKPQMKEKQ